MERCVHIHLYNYIISHKMISPFQSGFVQGDSTTYQFLHIYHTFCEAVDSGREVREGLCDITKAFGRVWHKRLLHRMFRSGSEMDTSYLSGRR